MIKRILKLLFYLLVFFWKLSDAQTAMSLMRPSAHQSVFLRSKELYYGGYDWRIRKVNQTDSGQVVSSRAYNAAGWLPAVVPGTVLNSLIYNKKYPDPYYGDNNRYSRNLIPDIADAGREFYHYWFRTKFSIPATFSNKRLWLKFHGINYKSTIWLNGQKLGTIDGMFRDSDFDITKVTYRKGENVLAVDVLPVDFPGSVYRRGNKRMGAVGENNNGGDGEIGKNVTMLMSVGWDFTSPDGIRDRNTGIWRDVELFATGDVILRYPFVESHLPLPDTAFSNETISVEVNNASGLAQRGKLTGTISGTKIQVDTEVILKPYEARTIIFRPADFPQLKMTKPCLWWPVNKGLAHLYTLTFQFKGVTGVSHGISTRFGVREISSDQSTPDKSRRFLVNGYPIFIRGTNWVPEAMLKNTPERTYSELRYTQQAGLNLLRLWGGGIAESDYFYQLCDEFGILVWNEFWLTGDTQFPVDTALYLNNLAGTVKRIRNHPSLAYYVASNELGEVKGTAALVRSLDSTRGYQVQSECCGIHDGSPYKYENPMQYYENTASKRGSRVDGFNPEYGAPCLPVIGSLQKMMPPTDIWPINDSVWNYLDGNGFHGMTTKYRQAVNNYGQSSTIEEFVKKGQLVGAMNFRAIWEVWNYNKFGYGDRWASGFLFWYHNSPLPQTASRMYDWFLEPTAALYYSKNGLAPLHPQFDYLKNTVSVYNDYRKSFSDYSVEADIYDLRSKLVFTKKVVVNIPADGLVKDAIKLEFPEHITQVHFIKLSLKDATGKLVSDAFYWRSKDSYKGAWTMTGPAVSGFEEINKLPRVKLHLWATQETVGRKTYLVAKVKNTSDGLSFFTQLRLQDRDGENIPSTFYSDNFFSLLPGETRDITIEVLEAHRKKVAQLVCDAFNADSVTIKL